MCVQHHALLQHDRPISLVRFEAGHQGRHARIAIGSGAGAREFLMDCPHATQAATSAYKVKPWASLHMHPWPADCSWVR